MRMLHWQQQCSVGGAAAVQLVQPVPQRLDTTMVENGGLLLCQPGTRFAAGLESWRLLGWPVVLTRVGSASFPRSALAFT